MSFMFQDFFPSYLTYGLHFNNKRVNYLKTKELAENGRCDLERIQYLLDYNWTGRWLVSHNVENSTPIALWPNVMERIWKGRTCFWTGREQGSELQYAHSVTYSLLREHLVSIFKSSSNCETNTNAKRRHMNTEIDRGGKKSRI